MPSLIIQQGHCYRTTGATGTTGEQQYATAVADQCMLLLNGKGGWSVRRTLADVNDYRADAFFAVHCDGSTNASARGASAGYRTPEGQGLAHAWQRAYAARGWTGGFRPDNYTAALQGYYGVRNAVAAGTRRAMIAECGFLTSPADRALLLDDDGPRRVALALGDALGIPHGADQPHEKELLDMDYLLQGGTSGPPSFTGVNVYVVIGPYLVGLDGDERSDAIDAINNRGASFQWVTRPTVEHLDARSHALYDKGPVVDALKSLVVSQSALGDVLTRLLEITDQIQDQLSEGSVAVRVEQPEEPGVDS